MKTKRIILCGLGNVGKTFLRLLAEREKEVQAKYGLKLEVGCVADIGGAALAQDALPLGQFLNYIQAGGKPENFQDYGRPGLSGVEAIRQNKFDVLVETTPTNLKDGEPAAGFVRAAIAAGLDVVAANKGPFVLFFEELQELAKAQNSRLFLSAATGAAMPSLDVGRYSTAGATITAIEGVLNGTTNFILTKMTYEKCTYQDALKEAQAMGIAETDPTLDVEGYDARNKLILLSNTLLGTKYGLADVPVTGITKITPADIEQAAAEGKVLKLVASAEIIDGIVSLSVQPMALEQKHPLAGINYSEKGVTYTTDTMGQITVFGGKSSPLGAAAALLKDIINSSL